VAAVGSALTASTAASTAATNAKNYASVSAALADAALIVGTQFSVLNGLQLDFYRKDAGPVAAALYWFRSTPWA
jgi:predicted ABC-type sugar transport system permease subunit